HQLFTASEEERLEAVRPAVSYFLGEGCDTIILGCTHFTHVAAYIADVAGDGVQIVDSRDGVSKQALKVWRDKEQADGRQVTSPLAGVILPYKDDLPPDKSFFVSLLRSQEDEKEYHDLCASYNIPWGGQI
ncbi:MAG: aspartate/glutamate racemase family protein, partial [Treponema sp.]|nr:aspartate/glutamate racemase family protein [Treponema sp.]